MPAPPDQGELVPGNFLTFDFFLQFNIKDRVCTGFPARPMRIRSLTGAPTITRWVIPIEIFLAKPPLPTLCWIENAERGIGDRDIQSIEDLLGAEGMIQEHLFRFEQILDAEPKQVVYALFNPQSGSRIAYSFERKFIEGSSPQSGDTHLGS